MNVYEPAPKAATGTEAEVEPLRFRVPLAGGLAKVTVTLAVKVSSVELFGVPLLLQTEKLVAVILLTVQVSGGVEQDAGAVPALLLVNVHAGVAENVAVRAIGVPSALIVTPVNL